MQLDGVTLLVAGCFVAAFSSIILVAAWTQMRDTPALLWWAVGHLVNCCTGVSFAIGLVTREPLTAVIGSGCIATSMILYWLGVRAFFSRELPLRIAAGAAALWVIAALLPFPGTSPRIPVATAFLLTVVLLCLACRELWRASKEHLVTRWPLMATLGLHAAFMGIGLLQLALGNVIVEAAPSVGTWFGIIHFERLVFVIGSSLLMVLMARERAERAWLAAASVDSLTGVANRSAFFSRAQRIYRRAHECATPVSLIAFDLDHFKVINDTHGHGVGDQVLRIFADTAVSTLRPADWFGRIGGEEFLAILPGAGIDVAALIADRIRHAFTATPRIFGGAVVHATVSAGVASATVTGGLDTLLEQADRALYQAKALGRNRIERAVETAPAIGDSRVGRVA